MAQSKKPSARSKALKQDDSIQGTNNSSIVSKRSVERLYFADEPHFFRHFVKKPQRRSPLINRGYWLRMKAIDHVVRQFLEESSEKSKVVINLGAGYDPLPWQCLSRYPGSCEGVKFVDVDYRDLMLKKRAVVLSTPELNFMLSDMVSAEDEHVLFHSQEYIQIGCDLRDTATFAKVLSQVIDLENCLILLTAEVSITYMYADATDSLIQWAGSLPQARFCVLEQIMPQGPDHPFARTMMKHFDKLQTPLRSVQKYPTIAHQRSRFSSRGWTCVDVKNLWKLWSSPDFLTASERRALDAVEPFDEWEEFALFGCHYFLLVAGNEHFVPAVTHEHSAQTDASPSTLQRDISPASSYIEYSKLSACRRFASTTLLQGPYGDQCIGIFAGMGLNARMDTFDAFSNAETPATNGQLASARGPSARMCHSMTALDNGRCMLVGGRASPNQGLTDCWILRQSNMRWESSDSLPSPRYRHSAVSIGNHAVLVIGGKIDASTVSTQALLWTGARGWTVCKNDGSLLPKVSGAFVTTTSMGTAQGLLAGGMTEDGCINTDIWEWEVRDLESAQPVISYTVYTSAKGSLAGESLIHRFGATVCQRKDCTMLVGGIASDRLFDTAEEIIVLSVMSSSNHTVALVVKELETTLSPRPLLIGSSAIVHNNDLIIIGGGAVCFSFGTFWNTGSHTIKLAAGAPTSNGTSTGWNLLANLQQQYPAPESQAIQETSSRSIKETESMTITPVDQKSKADFSRIARNSQPAVFREVPLGACLNAWDNDYLVSKIGHEHEVTVHRARQRRMDFVEKNFDYVKMPIGEFLEAIDNSAPLYLRSLSAQQPADLPAKLSTDYPSIYQDFVLPEEFTYAKENEHSSPLRISGPVDMWLHYDVMANILCQIRGTKRMVLFPPSDVPYLGFTQGSSSSRLDVFRLLESQHGETHPMEVLLQPGDVLFIPPLWLHAARPLKDVSISVNLFFRNMPTGYAAGRDVYGNRDIQAYEKSRQDISKIVKSFEGLPAEMREFYLLRLVGELRSRI